MSILQVRLNSRKSYLGLLAVASLISLTLYMAFAFPYQLFGLRQSETSELKSVIIVASPGERTPTPEAYFLGEEEPEELVHLLGHDQLTNQGKERLYLLGKFLKLRYYHLLLEGNPRRLFARSSDQEAALESAQALLAGLNPPKDSWCWWSGGAAAAASKAVSGAVQGNTDELVSWQPKAVHTSPSSLDDLLSPKPAEWCPRLEVERSRWKNSTRYQQLLNEFRHDLQTLRADTGLEFEEDLEMLAEIEGSLRARRAYGGAPSWFTPTFAQRLAHIADVTAQSRYSSVDTQRLLVGRLLHEIMANVNGWIHLDRSTTTTLGTPTMSTSTSSASAAAASSSTTTTTTSMPQVRGKRSSEPAQVAKVMAAGAAAPSPRGKQAAEGANVFLYMTDKDRLAALLSSLQIYSTQPAFGSLLIIELHYSPINELYFMRLFTVSADSPNIFPEPLRVNPLACLDSAECNPQQFEQNIRHLMLDQASWRQACNSQPSAATTTTTSTSTTTQVVPTQGDITTAASSEQEPASSDRSMPTSTAEPLQAATTSESPSAVTPSNATTTTAAADDTFLDDHLIVGPTHNLTYDQNITTTTAAAPTATTIAEQPITSSTTVEGLPNSSTSRPEEAETTITTTAATTTTAAATTTTSTTTTAQSEPRSERTAPVLVLNPPVSTKVNEWVKLGIDDGARLERAGERINSRD